MNERVALSLFLLAGGGLFFYLYYLLPRSFDRTHRAPAPRLAWYTWVDHYLKATTLAIPLLALWLHSGWLLLLHDSSVLRWVGVSIAGAGCGLLWYALRTLADQFAPCDFARLPTRVVQSGPYRWVRHPIYAANLILLAGLAVMSGSAWMMVNWLLLWGCYRVIARGEEAMLREWSDEYAEFADRRGRFFPRLALRRR